MPTPATTSRFAIATSGTTRHSKRATSDSQGDASSDVEEISAPAITKRNAAPMAKTENKSANKGTKKSTINASDESDSNIEEIPAPKAKAIALKHDKAPPPSHKRKASADIPAPSIEVPPLTAPKRPVGRPPKRIKTASLPKIYAPKNKGNGKAKSDPIAVEDEEELDVDFEYDNDAILGDPFDSGLAAYRDDRLAVIIGWELRKGKKFGNDPEALMNRLVRKRKAEDDDLATDVRPLRKKSKFWAIEEPVVETKPVETKPVEIKPVVIPNDFAPLDRTRRAGSNKASSLPTTVASALDFDPSKTLKIRAKTAARVEEAAEEAELEQPWPEHPPILEQTPTPLRVFSPGGDDPDGFDRPSVTTTIQGPDGRRYREIEMADDQGGEEKTYWVPVKEKRVGG
jgi:hypothetical protein